jgi:alpha-beta hydrolase superfamily lysophospholipase
MIQKAYTVLDRPEVTSVLFYPRRDVGMPRLAQGAFPVRIPVADDIQVGGKIFAAGDGAPVILYFHGNGEIASDYDTIAPFYTRLGITLFVVDYRGYGLSEGKPSATSLIEDAWATFGRMRAVMSEQGLGLGEVYVMGRSLGSAAALEIVDRAGGDGIAGLIIESGFAYTFALIERLGFLQVEDAFEHKDGFGNLDKIARARLRTLIIHGERDWIIPISDAHALYASAAAANKKLVRIPGAGHNDLMLVGRQTYFEAIAAFCGKAAPADPADDPPIE